MRGGGEAGADLAGGRPPQQRLFQSVLATVTKTPQTGMLNSKPPFLAALEAQKSKIQEQTPNVWRCPQTAKKEAISSLRGALISFVGAPLS